MSGVHARPCICPADACFKVKSGAYCRHSGKVLARFVDRWNRRFAAYVRPGTCQVGTRTSTGARCTSVEDPPS